MVGRGGVEVRIRLLGTFGKNSVSEEEELWYSFVSLENLAKSKRVIDFLLGNICLHFIALIAAGLYGLISWEVISSKSFKFSAPQT